MDTKALLMWLLEAVPQGMRIVEGTDGLKKNLLHYPDWVIDPYIHTGEDMSGVLWTAFEDQGTKYYFVNYTDEVQEITVQVCSGIHPEIWDTYTGAIEPAQVVEEKRDGNGTQYQIRMRLPKDYGVFLVTG